MNTSIQSSNKPFWLRCVVVFLLIGIAGLSFILLSEKKPSLSALLPK